MGRRLVFTVQDLQRDGFSLGGLYRLQLDGVVVAEGTGNFGAEQVTSLSPGCTETIRIGFNPDANAEFETTWDLLDGMGNLLAAGSSSGGLVCTALESEYVLNVYDSYGDGLGHSGSYDVVYGGRTVASGGEFSFSETSRFSRGCQHTIGVHVDAIGDTLFQQQPNPSWELRSVDAAKR